MNPVKIKIVFLFLFVFLQPQLLFSQKTVLTLHCGDNFENCDTVSIEDYNAKDQILYRIKFAEPKSSIEYLYTKEQVLYKKVHRNADGIIQKTNNIYSDSSGSWHTDSLIHVSGKVLYVFKRKPTEMPNNYMIEWFFKRDPNPSSRQIIQYDESGKELSNSTCYSADNCVTYVFYYNGDQKIRSELWAMDGPNSQPIQKEIEEFVYENGTQPTYSIRFAEPAHSVGARFKYVLLDKPIQKK